MGFIYSSGGATPLPSGRTITRHKSDMGSVLGFDMFGKKVKLFIPDAKYRSNNAVYWGKNSDIPAIPNINIEGYTVTGGSFDYKKHITNVPTDAEIQGRMSQCANDGTAKSNTDAMISVIGSGTNYAAGLARSVNIQGLGPMDLPNAYELAVIWAESDNIDAYDPTASSYSALKLGYTNPNGRFHAKTFWSSTESASIYAITLTYNAYMDSLYKSGNSNCVCPCLELSIA